MQVRPVVLALLALCALAAAPAFAQTQVADNISGVWRYEGANQDPEEITITKIGDFAYRLEVMNTSTRVSRFELLGYFREGVLNAAGIDRPGYGLRMVACWTGRMTRPGVIEIRSMPLPGNVNYDPQTAAWSTTPLQLVKLR